MSESFRITLGDPLPLSLTLPDAATGLFPQAVVYDSSDVQVGGSPFNLTEVGATGRYTDAAFTPAAVGTFVVLFVVYSDAGHINEVLRYERAQDSYAVLDVVEAIFARVMETGFSFDRMVRIMAAAMAGKTTGGKGSQVFRNLADLIDQFSMDANANGDRDNPTYGA